MSFNKSTLLTFTICMIFLQFFSGVKSGNVGSGSPTQVGSGALTPQQYCRKYNNGVVLRSRVRFDSAGGVLGLEKTFCFMRNSAGNLLMLDLQTLTSSHPSIAATYLLKGIDTSSLLPVTNISDVCKALLGSDVSYYSAGGFVNPYGEDDICVFGDGSAVSTWGLVYATTMPGYFNLQNIIRSNPLPLNLPYLASSTPVQCDKQVGDPIQWGKGNNASTLPATVSNGSGFTIVDPNSTGSSVTDPNLGSSTTPSYWPH